MQTVLRFLRRFPAGRARLLLCLVLQFILSWSSLINAEVMRTGTIAIEARDFSTLRTTGFWIAAAILVNIVFAYIAKLLRCRAVLQYEQDIQTRMADQMMRMKKAEFSQYKTGEVTTAVINNAADAAENCISCVYGVFSGTAVIFACLLYMAVIDWRIMLAIALFQVLIRCSLKLFEKRVRAVSAETIAAEKAGNSLLFDMLRGMLTIRTGGREAFFNRELQAREEASLRARLRRHLWSNGQFEFIWTSSKVVEYLVLYGFGGLLACWGRAELSTVFSFVFVLESMVDGLNTLGGGLNGKSMAAASIASVEKFLDPLQTEDEPLCPLPGGELALCAEELCFSFGERKILDHVSFSVAPGEKILITGPNGGGKSTLLALIAGLYRPDSGTLRYGGEDVRCVNLDSLAACYSRISQQSDLLDGTVFENLALSRDYDEECCRAVLREMNMEGCRDASPSSLSQGEKQRINIGRAFYRAGASQIVLGDEIFSNVDRQNAARIASAMAETFSGQTVLMVCHEETPFPFDRVFHVENGCVTITEGGTAE